MSTVYKSLAIFLISSCAYGVTLYEGTCRSFAIYDGEKHCLVTRVENDAGRFSPQTDRISVTDPTEGEIVEIVEPTIVPDE